MSRRLVTIAGVTAVGGGAYYLYSAGGDPKLAEKQFEHDAARASAKFRSEIPGRSNQAEKAGSEGLERVKSGVRELSNEAKAEADKIDAKLYAYRQEAAAKLDSTKREAGKEITSAADAFDKKVLEGTQKSKSWLGSWFG